MSRPGTAADPIRVAVVGAGPAGFFAVEHLFRRPDVEVRVDLYERLPVPYGLVRFGVAPDHLKIKNVVKKWERLGDDPRFRFFGNCELGRDFTIDDLRRDYHAAVLTTGAQTDRRLGIPGEDLRRSHPATEFVAWYNGHPDFRDRTFDLSIERVAVVGIGNVAVDVARILCRTPDELLQSDIAPHALEALRESRVREVVMIGRRGAAQAAFTNPEIKELGELEGADCVVRSDEIALDDVSREAIGDEPDRDTARKLDILASYTGPPSGKPRRLAVRFLLSPTEILDDGEGGVGGLRLVRNRLKLDRGRVRAEPTDVHETLDCGMVFRSVGYRGVALPGVPFRDDWGTVPESRGRVLDAPGGEAVPGLFVAGWIKRGPSGVIGTNKPDAAETVDSLLEDVEAGRCWSPGPWDAAAVERSLAGRGVRAVTFPDWRTIDAAEIAAGQAIGRPRIKLSTIEDLLAALDR